MNLAYYPGCSLTGTAKDYDMSARAAMETLGVSLRELTDWNCCGASAVPSTDPDLGVAISARNLALAENSGEDLAVACASCYTNLRRAKQVATGRTPAGDRIRASLAETGQAVRGTTAVRHLLDLVVNEVGLDTVRAKVQRPLKGLKVAAYYGCQLSRPGGGFDHPERPQVMDRLLEALGAEPVEWWGKARCCGSSLMMTKEQAAMPLIDMLLLSASGAGARIVATACSVCQMNLDAYQGRARSDFGRNYQIPVVYFTQLMGLAFGIAPDRLGFEKAFEPSRPVLQPYLEGVMG